MKYLCIAERYESNGEKKVKWYRIGEMFEGKNGKQYAKLYANPSQLIHVFEKKKEEAKDDLNF